MNDCVVCDLLCGDVWCVFAFVALVCVMCLNVCGLIVMYCVMVYGRLFVLVWACVLVLCACAMCVLKVLVCFVCGVCLCVCYVFACLMCDVVCDDVWFVILHVLFAWVFCIYVCVMCL